jgi:hypothetical protein
MGDQCRARPVIVLPPREEVPPRPNLGTEIFIPVTNLLNGCSSKSVGA